MDKHHLIITQVDRKLAPYAHLKNVTLPDQGWIKSIRTALKMTLKQLGKRMNITPQSVKEIEMREKAGTVSINVLKKFGEALEMQFVYGFIPQSNSLEKMIEEKAFEVAQNIVMRTAKNMEIEDQSVQKSHLEKAILELKNEIIREMPNYLWE